MSHENPRTIAPYCQVSGNDVDGTWYTIATNSGSSVGAVIKIETLTICNSSTYDNITVTLSINNAIANVLHTRIPPQSTLHAVTNEAPMYLTGSQLLIKAEYDDDDGQTGAALDVIVGGLEITP